MPSNLGSGAVATALATLIPLTAVAQQADLQTSTDVIVVFSGQPERGEAAVRARGGVVTRSLPIVNGAAARIPLAAWGPLARHPNVAFIEQDAVAHAVGKPTSGGDTTPPAQETPWGIERVGAPTAWGWAGGTYGAGVKVGVIDTGIGPHADVDPNVKGGYDFVRGRSGIAADDNGHGTHVAGTIAAVDDASSVVGVAPQADLYAIKVLDRRGSGSYSQVIAGIQWAADLDPANPNPAGRLDVINMSLGGESPSEAMELALAAARAAGVVIVVAAGNDFTTGNDVQYPAAYTDHVLAVAATDVNDVQGYFSSTGFWVDVAAPGVDILSTLPGNELASYNGTSMATPHVAGVAALLLSAEPGLTVAEVEERLTGTADGNGWNEVFGHGIVDAPAALDPPVPPTYDLAVAGVSAPSAAALGDTVTVVVSVVNRGLTAASTAVVLGDGAGLQSALVADLAPGEQVAVPFEVTLGTAGDVVLAAELLTADTYEALGDEDPSNDGGSTALRVIDPATTPILRVTDIAYRDARRDLIVDVIVGDGSAPVAGVQVEVTLLLDGTPIGTGSATTAEDGKVSFKLRNAPSGRYTTSVNALTKDWTLYDPTLDVADPGHTR